MRSLAIVFLSLAVSHTCWAFKENEFKVKETDVHEYRHLRSLDRHAGTPLHRNARAQASAGDTEACKVLSSSCWEIPLKSMDPP